MTLTSAFVEFIVGVGLVSPLVYFGVPLGASGSSVSAQEAVAVALAGFVSVWLAEIFLGWGSLVELILTPIIWISAVKHLCPIRWPTATGIGILGWGISAIAISFLPV
jgi:hypothetical protein